MKFRVRTLTFFQIQSNVHFQVPSPTRPSGSELRCSTGRKILNRRKLRQCDKFSSVDTPSITITTAMATSPTEECRVLRKEDQSHSEKLKNSVSLSTDASSSSSSSQRPKRFLPHGYSLDWTKLQSAIHTCHNYAISVCYITITIFDFYAWFSNSSRCRRLRFAQSLFFCVLVWCHIVHRRKGFKKNFEEQCKMRVSNCYSIHYYMYLYVLLHVYSLALVLVGTLKV